MNDKDFRNYGYACLLAGGLVIIVGSLLGAAMLGVWDDAVPAMMGDEMMGLWTPAQMADVIGEGVLVMAWWMGGFGLLSGSLVLFAAYLARTEGDATTAGTLGIVGGALSILAMGGWMIGALLAIVGGALLIASRNARAAPRAT